MCPQGFQLRKRPVYRIRVVFMSLLSGIEVQVSIPRWPRGFRSESEKIQGQKLVGRAHVCPQGFCGHTWALSHKLLGLKSVWTHSGRLLTTLLFIPTL